MASVLVRVFEHEPELLRNLRPRDAARAGDAGIARRLELAPGEWRPPLVRLGAGDLGLLIVNGLIIRRTEVIGRSGVELLGAGDIARPWRPDDESLVPATLTVAVCEPTSVAVLDRGFVETISRWPEILAQILERMSTRATSLAFQLAIARLPTLESRLLCMLWHLAERWGHVSRDGIVVRLKLPHHILADLTSSSRPSVSSALGRLKARGLVERCGSRQCRLLGDPPDELEGLPKRSLAATAGSS